MYVSPFTQKSNGIFQNELLIGKLEITLAWAVTQ